MNGAHPSKQEERYTVGEHALNLVRTTSREA